MNSQTKSQQVHDLINTFDLEASTELVASRLLDILDVMNRRIDDIDLRFAGRPCSPPHVGQNVTLSSSFMFHPASATAAAATTLEKVLALAEISEETKSHATPERP